MKYNDAMSNLMAFINNVESTLLSEHAVTSDEKTMQDQCQKFQELEKSLKSRQVSFEYANQLGQELMPKSSTGQMNRQIKEQLQDLNTKWNDISIILEERQHKLTNGRRCNL